MKLRTKCWVRRTVRVRAPGARTAAPKVKNCRTGATMLSNLTCQWKLNHSVEDTPVFFCTRWTRGGTLGGRGVHASWRVPCSHVACPVSLAGGACAAHA